MLALDAVAAAAQPLVAELAKKRVSVAHLAALSAAIAACRPLVGTPRGQIIQGSTLRTTGRKLTAELREAFRPLDTRLDTLEEDFPELVALYRRARRLVKGGGGAAPASGPNSSSAHPFYLLFHLFFSVYAFVCYF